MNSAKRDSVMRCVHYGSGGFDTGKFQPVSNYRGWPNKPKGGLWASPVDAPYGWADWCRDEGYYLADESFEFTLSPNARIAEIRFLADIQGLPGYHRGDGICQICTIDFEVLKNQIDAVDFRFSENPNELYYGMYGWDCDSVLILNPQVVIPIYSSVQTRVFSR